MRTPFKVLLIILLMVVSCSAPKMEPLSEITVYEIIRHKGYIQVGTIPEEGAVFFLLYNGDNFAAYRKFSRVELIKLSNQTDRTVATFAKGVLRKMQ